MLYFCVAKPICLYYIYADCDKKRSGKIEILHFFRIYSCMPKNSNIQRNGTGAVPYPAE